MATDYTATSYATPALARPQSGPTTRWFAHDIGSSFTFVINDKVKFFKLPAGAKIVPGWGIEADDLDAGATATLTLSLAITDGTTTKTIIDGSVAGQAGGVCYDHTATYGQQADVMGFVTTNDDFYVYVLAKAAAAGAGAASSKLKVWCTYTLDTEAGEV